MMQKLKIEISQRAYEELVARAVDNRRAIHQQAAVMLTEALGLPFPEPPEAFEWPQPNRAEVDASELTASA